MITYTYCHIYIYVYIVAGIHPAISVSIAVHVGQKDVAGSSFMGTAAQYLEAPGAS